jgi:excinuclease UvrABC nuclease subunit
MKGEKEAVYRYEKDWKIASKELEYDDVDRLVTSLRDEAHRFANAYRTKQMSMERKNAPVKKTSSVKKTK